MNGLEEALQSNSLVSWLVGYLWTLMSLLGQELTTEISPHVLNILPVIMSILLIWYSLKLIMIWGPLEENFRQIMKVCLLGGIATVVLASPTSLFSFVVSPIVNAGSNLGRLVLWTTLDPDMKNLIESGKLTPGEGIANIPIAEMVWLVDRQIDWIIYLGYKILNADSGVWYVVNYGPRLLAAAPLLIGGVFLLSLFTAYCVEALYKFLAAMIALPLAVMAAMIPAGRPYFGAVIRLLLGGAFTLFFLAVAMGFTGRAVSSLEPYIVGEMTGAQVEEIDAAQTKVDVACASRISRKSSECAEARIALENIETANEITVFGPAYIVLLVLLVVSVIVHMAAKTIAMNLAGVNDGPGPAAMVVGAATAGAGAMWGASKWTAAKAAAPIARGAETISRRMPWSSGGGGAGASDILASRRVPTDSAGAGDTLGNTPGASSPPPSSGSGGGAGADFSGLKKSIDELNKTMKSRGPK